MAGNRARGNKQKQEHGKFHLNMWKNFFALQVTKHSNRFPRKAVQSYFAGNIPNKPVPMEPKFCALDAGAGRLGRVTAVVPFSH